ncbi:MAG: RIP metalloprotease RseP [Candidatus Dojkabacteria bacterium]
MMDAFLTIFFFVLIIGFLVLIHELGHFLAAKVTGVKVNEFAIGFGPKILSYKFHDTDYQIRLLPLGGFVSLAGEKDASVQGGFRSKSLPVKTFILTGGVIMNFIGALIFLGIFLNTQDSRISLPNLVEYTFTNTVKQETYYPIGISSVPEGEGFSNISEGDVIVAINDNKITSASDFATRYSSLEGNRATVTFFDLQTFETTNKEVVFGEFSNGNFFEIVVTEVVNEDSNLKVGDRIVGINNKFFQSYSEFISLRDQFAGSEVIFNLLNYSGELEERLVNISQEGESGMLGIFLDREDSLGWTPLSSFENRAIYFLEFKQDLITPVTFTIDLTMFQLEGIGNLLSDAFTRGDFTEASQALGGPVAVGGVVNDVVEFRAYDSLIFITALISLSLAIFNILPIPALDGGQLMIAIIESVRRKQLKDETIEKINFIGFLFLIFLSLLIMAKDIVQLDIISGASDWIQKVFGK